MSLGPPEAPWAAEAAVQGSLLSPAILHLVAGFDVPMVVTVLSIAPGGTGGGFRRSDSPNLTLTSSPRREATHRADLRCGHLHLGFGRRNRTSIYLALIPGNTGTEWEAQNSMSALHGAAKEVSTGAQSCFRLGREVSACPCLSLPSSHRHCWLRAASALGSRGGTQAGMGVHTWQRWATKGQHRHCQPCWHVWVIKVVTLPCLPGQLGSPGHSSWGWGPDFHHLFLHTGRTL